MLKSQWRGVDITTFPTEQLWEWVDRLVKEMEMLRAEIDRRAVEATDQPKDEPTDVAEGGDDPPTDQGGTLDGRPTGGGTPPQDGGRRVRNPFSSDNFEP